MIDTILFDLDGTLLLSDGDEFTKAYFAALGKFMADLHDPDQLLSAVWAGTKAMIKNDGSRTNEAAFWETYCGIFGKEAAAEEPVFAAFYRTRYTELKTMCGKHPGLDGFIKALRSSGYKLVVATNPLFPLFVQKERITWTGADPDDFARITSYENSHYSKPNPAYYREILEEIGSSPENSLMVGNDVKEDMETAAALGMKGFLMTGYLLNREGKDISGYPQGGFSELQEYIEALSRKE